MRKPCLGVNGRRCRNVTAIGSRCPPCQAMHDAWKLGGWQRKAERFKQGKRCVDCGTAGTSDNPLTVDHVKPRALGGASDINNLAVRCRRCNSAKGTT